MLLIKKLAAPLLICVLLLVLLAGVYIRSFVPEPEIVTTFDDGAAPETCNPAAVAQILVDFTKVVNENNQPQIARMLDSDYFQWYSVGSEFSSRYQPRTALYDYLTERHRQQEVIVIRQVSSSYQGGQRDNANAIFVIEVTANNFAQKYGITRFIAVGKGAVKCTDGKRSLMVWSIPSPKTIIDFGEDGPQLCPPTTQVLSDNSVLACSTQPLTGME